MKTRKQLLILWVITILLTAGWAVPEASSKHDSKLRFEISFTRSVHKDPITGRVFVFISENQTREPRLQAGSWRNSVPFFGLDVENLQPGETVIIDEHILGYPPKSLESIPSGDYFVQVLFHVYTLFPRSDGHTIWAHMDQWEGQHFNRSPGNLIGDVRQVPLDPDEGYTVRLEADRIIPPVEEPDDTEWVKHIKIKSKLLSDFWGHPITLGAIVLLPRGYDEHPDVHYPVHYQQGHFSLRPPAGMPLAYWKRASARRIHDRRSRLNQFQGSAWIRIP